MLQKAAVWSHNESYHGIELDDVAIHPQVSKGVKEGHDRA